MVIWYSHLFQNFPQFIVIHIVKSFGVVSEDEVNVFLEISYIFFFVYPLDVGNLISGSSAFSKTSLNIWNFMVHILLKLLAFLFSLAFLMIQQMDIGNLISGSSTFSKFSLNIWNFMVHVLLKPGLENF